MKKVMTTRRTGSQLSREVSGVSQRTLGLLKAIEETIDCLKSERDVMVVYADLASELARKIALQDRKELIDAHGTLEGLVPSVLAEIRKAHEGLTARRASARKDSRLTDEDGISETFDQCIRAAEDMHNAFLRLNEAICEHDADLDEILPGKYSNAKDLIADLIAALRA